MAGWLQVAAERGRLEQADRLYVQTMAARGHERDVKVLLREWRR